MMGGIKDGRIRIGNLMTQAQKIARDRIAMLSRQGQVLNCSFRPDCPMAQQAAREADGPRPEFKNREQVEQDVIIVSGVQRDLASPAGISNGPDNFDGLIAIEGSYLDGDYIL